MQELTWSLDDPLQRCRGETRGANRALHDYAMMGEGMNARSLRRLLENYKNRAAMSDEASSDASIALPPTLSWNTLSGWSRHHCWQDRCARFDELQREADVRKYAARRVVDRETRIHTLQTYRTKTLEALDKLVPTAANWNDVTGALRMVTEELRREFGEVDQVLELRGNSPGDSPAAHLTDAELRAAVANLLIGQTPPEANG